MKPFRIGVRLVPVYVIPVQVLENEEDWEFVAIKDNNGYHIAVF